GSARFARPDSSPVGIGFGDPLATFDNGGIYIGRNIDAGEELSFGGFGGFSFHVNDTPGATSTPVIVISETGELGIGTTNPTTELEVVGTASSTNLYVAGGATSTSLYTTTLGLNSEYF